MSILLEPSYQEMKAVLSKEHPTTIKKKRKKVIWALIMGLPVGVAFRIAWDLGVIAFVYGGLCNYSCSILADWEYLIKEAFG